MEIDIFNLVDVSLWKEEEVVSILYKERLGAEMKDIKFRFANKTLAIDWVKNIIAFKEGLISRKAVTKVEENYDKQIQFEKK